MTHVYYHPITVTLAKGKPATLRWRGITYQVLELNEPWHLMDRWWESPPSDTPGTRDMPEVSDTKGGTKGRSDRIYY